jgi:putative CocE/NonD family hydrolase
VNPYGIRIIAAAPGHTFYDLYRSLAPNECFKLSFGALVLGVYYTAAGAIVDPYFSGRWGAAFMSGSVEVRDQIRPELALRSPKSYAPALSTVPSLWVQAFDDNLFPVDEAVDWFHENTGKHRLWLSWGGHAAPSSNVSELERSARNTAWQLWLDHYLKGTANRVESGPPVTYWYMDPEDSTHQYRATAPDWPPPAAKQVSFYLSAGELGSKAPAQDSETLLFNNPAVVSDITADPIGNAVAQAVPMGSTLPASIRTAVDTAVFAGPEFSKPMLLAGSPSVHLNWSSSASVFQTNALLWDVYPDGRRSLITRGCSLQANVPDLPGESQDVELDMFDSARLLAAGHHLELWVSTQAQPTFLASSQPSLNSVNYMVANPSVLRLPLLTPPATRS